MDDLQALFNQALAAARQKDFGTARALLKQLVKQDPNNLNAWLLAGMVVKSRSDSIRCYQRALQIDPTNAHAKQKLAQLESEAPVATASVQPAASQPVNVQINAAPRPEIRPAQAASRPTTQAELPDDKSKAGNGMVIGLLVLAGILCLALFGLIAYSFSSQAKPASDPTPANQQLSKPAPVNQPSSEPTPTNQQLFSVLSSNTQAFNREDATAYMATIHSQSPGYVQTETLLKQLFAKYDLEGSFYDLKVLSASPSEARVHFSLSTRKLAGPDFRNNVVTGVMILRPEAGVWKIYNQEVENVTY